MRSSSLVVLVSLAVGLNAGPTGLKRDDATPVLEAREPAFSVNIPNNIPVSGAFRNGITVTPKTGGGSIVSGNNNSTLFGQLFGRDDATPALAAREPAFSLNIPNNIPVSGAFRDGITVTPKTGGGSIVTGNNNSTLFGKLFGRDDATPALQARAPQFSLNIPNNIPVSGAFRNGLTVTPKVGGGSIVTGNRNSTLLGQLFGGFKRDEDGTPTLEAREPAFSVNIPNNIPVSGAFRNGITVTPKTGGGSIVTGNNNSTLFGQLFGRDDATPALQARAPQFSLNIPNNIPVSGAFRNGLTVTPKVGGGSIVTGNRNSTLFGQLFGGFKRDEEKSTGTPTLAAREPAFSLNIPNNIPVSGAFRNGLTITPQTPSGSIVTGNNNSTLFGQLGSVFPFSFKREE
ncbi:hypothetical protein PENSPDRAFT_754849 [Peniophora sp. CONT]|nr:hypothetical protein PENSPDRAFT_754849 [Peniophora sp. CONT]